MFLAAGQIPTGGYPAGEAVIATSDDGVEWEVVYHDKRKKDGATRMYDLVVADQQTIAVGGHGSHAGNSCFFYSEDGRHWKEGSTFVQRTGSPVASMFTVGYGNGRYAAFGGAPAHYRCIRSHSSDGRLWSEPLKERIGGGRQGRKIRFGNGQLVLIGGDRRVAISEDAVEWREVDTDDCPGFVSLAFGKGRFVAGGLHGRIMTSDDAVDWRTTNQGDIGEHVNEIVFTGERFVAIGVEATFFSDDGLSWSRVTNNVRPARAVFGSGTFLCANGRGTKVYISEDAVTWKRIPDPDGFYLNGALVHSPRQG
jgi:hypothetical protein